MATSVKQLEKEFSLNGFVYRQVKRTKAKALYAQYNEGGMLLAHELVKITVLPAGVVFKKTYPDREHYPSNEEVGKLGWSITSDPKTALELFNNFVKFQKVVK